MVLIAGGRSGNNTLSSAELYDPTIGTWSTTKNMKEGRQYFTATGPAASEYCG